MRDDVQEVMFFDTDEQDYSEDFFPVEDEDNSQKYSIDPDHEVKGMAQARTNFFKPPVVKDEEVEVDWANEADVKIDSYQISLDRIEKPHFTDRLNIITERFNVINKQLTQFRV